MVNKINKDKSLIHECNIISTILNPMKSAKSKNSNYSPRLKGCMNTLSGNSKFINFRILLDSGSSSTIVMGKLMSKINQKITRNNDVGNPSGVVHDLKEGDHRFLSDRI